MDQALIDKADAILEHAGVKGMKWGIRRANKRAANAERNAIIDLSRNYVTKGGAKAALEANKAEYAAAQVHARKVFLDNRDSVYRLAKYSTQAKTGKETAIAMLSSRVGLQTYLSITGKGPSFKELLPGRALSNHSRRNAPMAKRFSNTETKALELQRFKDRGVLVPGIDPRLRKVTISD